MEKKSLICNFEKHGWIKTPAYTHTHTRRHCCSCFSLHVCQASFSLVHTLLKSWPLIYCILAPNIAYWPLDCAGQEMQGEKKKKNRRRDKVVKKRAKTTGRHPDSWGLRWSLCLAFRCLSRLRFGGRCGYQRSRQRETRSPGSRKRRREGGYREREKMRKCYKNLIRRSSTEVTFCVLQPFFFSKHCPREQDRLIFFFTGPN